MRPGVGTVAGPFESDVVFGGVEGLLWVRDKKRGKKRGKRRGKRRR